MFFRQFPTTQYDLLRTGALTTVIDLFRNVTAKGQIKLDPNLAYTYYRIRNGDRPDVVSQKIYTDSDYYWTFFIINDFLKDGLSVWPKNYDEMEEYLTQEYDRYSVIQMSDTITGFDETGTFATSVNGIDFSAKQYYVTDLSQTYVARIMKYDPSMQQLWIYNEDSNPDLVSNFSTFYIAIYDETTGTYTPVLSLQ